MSGGSGGLMAPGRPQRQTYRRANTSINLTGQCHVTRLHPIASHSVDPCWSFIPILHLTLGCNKYITSNLTYFPLANRVVFTGAVTDSDLFRSCSNILDKFGSKPTRDNLAVVNGSNRSPASASFKDFLLGRYIRTFLAIESV